MDGGGSLNRALLGDNLAQAAISNGWSGILINGCIRDSDEISKMDIGVKALATIPRKTVKRNLGSRDVLVEFCQASFHPGDYLYADSDGVVLSKKKLAVPKL